MPHSVRASSAGAVGYQRGDGRRATQCYRSGFCSEDESIGLSMQLAVAGNWHIHGKSRRLISRRLGQDLKVDCLALESTLDRD